MSRYSEGDDEGIMPYALWENAYLRALNGKRGQQAILDLYHALEALPQHRLISSHLARDGEVCAVGALALYRRTQAGEEAKAVLAALEDVHPAVCKCMHPRASHGPAGMPCSGCVQGAIRYEGWRDPTNHPYLPDVCTCYVYDEEWQEGGAEWDTANEGVRVGVAYTLAWQLGYLNDVTWDDCTPEARWQNMRMWCVNHLHPVPA